MAKIDDGAAPGDVIRVDGLHERHRPDGPEALGGVDFPVARGESFGLLGPKAVPLGADPRGLRRLLPAEEGLELLLESPTTRSSGSSGGPRSTERARRTPVTVARRSASTRLMTNCPTRPSQ